MVVNGKNVVPLPFYAAAELLPGKLPSCDEIEAAATNEESLLVNQTARKVISMGKFIVKYGAACQVDLLEGQTILFLHRHHLCSLTIPRIYALFQKEGKNYIIMERLEGSTLQDEWPRLTAAEKIDVASKLSNCIQEIRKLPSPTGGYCGLGSSPVPDTFFWKDSDEEQINGPFVTEEEFNRGLTDVLCSGSLTKPFRHLFFRRGVGTILKDHPPVFTHGDLQRKNILIRRTTGPNDGECAEFQVSLVDWESAGWYPTYWEYFKSMFACRWDDDWSEHLDTIILDPYYVEWSFCNTLFLEAFY